MALLNLILGVVVNVATEERERIAKEMEEERKQDRMEAHDKLYELCDEMDEDGNGTLSLEEIKQGYDTNPAFQRVMESMDIGRGDLDFVWTILDSDKSGTVTAKEFVTQIYTMKSSETQFLISYIRFYLTEIKHDLKDGQKVMKEDLTHGQVELQAKLRGGQEELHSGQVELVKKVRAGQDELARKLRGGQGELQKKLRSGQERLRQDIHKAMGFSGTFELLVDEEPAVKEEPEVKEQAGGSLDKDEFHVGDAVSTVGSFQWLDDSATLRIRTSNDANEVDYADKLLELHKIWKQCLVSIDDVCDRQSDLSALIQGQAKCLVSVMQCGPRTTATELEI